MVPTYNLLKENTLGTCRIRKAKTLWERGNVFSKPYASATTPWRLRGKVDETKSRRRKLNLDWFKSLTGHYLSNKLPIIPTIDQTQSSGPCRQNSYCCQFRRLQLSEISSQPIWCFLTHIEKVQSSFRVQVNFLRMSQTDKYSISKYSTNIYFPKTPHRGSGSVVIITLPSRRL